MPEPLEITSHLRTYSVSFVETLAEIAGEISSPGDFFIADPVVAEIVWGESPPEDRLLVWPPESRMFGAGWRTNAARRSIGMIRFHGALGFTRQDWQEIPL